MTQYDPSEILRQGIKTWWEAQSLSSLGPVALRADDGSPASVESDLPNTTIRIAPCVRDSYTNMATYWSCGLTIEVHHGSPEECATAINPLDALLEAMIEDDSTLPAMPRGYLESMRLERSDVVQIDPMLWRADRELSVGLVIDR